jgi:hypothetical protein
VIIDLPGTYRWTRDTLLRGPRSSQQYPAGTTIRISQVDSTHRKIIGPRFPDWQPWDQPLEPVVDEEVTT